MLKERVSDLAVLLDALQRIAEGECVGDGRDELLATLGDSGSLVVFRGRASGGLGSPEVYPLREPEGDRATALAVADVDGDGDSDVVAPAS